MACNCGASHCPECMGGWEPSPPPEKGSCGWKNDMAIQYCIEKRLLDKTRIIKLPQVVGVNLGYMAIRNYPGSGTDYFRVDDIENI